MTAIEEQASKVLFGHLPADVFRLFSGKARWFYADLLEYLADSVFVDGGLIPRGEAIEAIRQFVAGYALEAEGAGDTEPDSAFLFETDSAQRALIAYARLLHTGWLVEHRDRYRRRVDIDAAARLLLDTLIDIKSGRLRSYGGEVLQVLALLEAARGDPQNRSEAIRNAARSAKSFLNHLRSVGAAMRKAEEALVAQRDFTALFQSYFDDFVEKFLIEDFKRLHTQANPFRFRVRILELAADIEMDELLLRQLGAAYAAEGRTPDAERGVESVVQELGQIQRVFGELESYLELIRDTNRRIEKRIHNTVRYMDRIAETRTERITLAFRLLAEAPVAADGAVELPARQLGAGLPLGGDHLHQSVTRRAALGPKPIRRAAPDPAYVAYSRALQDYRMRSVVTPNRVIDYLERALAERDAVRAADLPIATLDDFFVFERLRALEHIEGGALAKAYQVTHEAGVIQNDWIACANFTIRRRKESAHVR